MQAQDVELLIPLDEVFEPVYLFAPASNGGSLITEPNGTVRFFYRIGPGKEGSSDFLYQDVSNDGGRTWYLGQLAMDTGSESLSEIAEINPFSGEIYLMYTRGEGRMIRSVNQRTGWTAEKRLPFSFDFTAGSLMWLRGEEYTGFHRMIAAVPAEGGGVTYLSDDDGDTWIGPSNLITSSVYSGRWDNPAGSPQIIELENGKLWMLTRNSQDHIWEYYSDDWGREWSIGRPSRFVGVFSNLRIKRISDGRLQSLHMYS